MSAGGPDRTVECPVCGAESSKIYRCSECGADFVERSTGEQSGGGQRGG